MTNQGKTEMGKRANRVRFSENISVWFPENAMVGLSAEL